MSPGAGTETKDEVIPPILSCFGSFELCPVHLKSSLAKHQTNGKGEGVRIRWDEEGGPVCRCLK